MVKRKRALFASLAAMLAFLFVLNACDMGYSDKEVVNVSSPRITRQPASAGLDMGVNEGDDAETHRPLVVMAALAAGESGTLSYQWYSYLTYRAYQDQAGIRIDGATGPSYTPPTGREGEFNYYVVVTNTNNAVNGQKVASVKSQPATVTVNDPRNAVFPVITSQPVGAALMWSPLMTLPTLEVLADVTPESASEELRYQWYAAAGTSNTLGGIAIEGATTARFIPPMAIEGEEPEPGQITGPGSYYYYVVVTNFKFDVPGRRESSVTSVPVMVSIDTSNFASEPEITGQPRSAIYFPGDAIQPLAVIVEEPEDGGTLSYQWFENTELANRGGTEIEGATDASFLPPITTSFEERYFYYVEVTNTNTFVLNPTATVTSAVAEVSSAFPASDGDKNPNATFTVLFGGTNQNQYVRGFGGMDVAWGNFPDYSEQDYENMYNPDILGYNLLRIMILPHSTDINKTMDELITNQIYTTMDRTRFYENVKTVNRYGGYVLASPWSPPAEWKTNNSINGGGSLRRSDYQNYANYLRSFAQNMLNNGAPVYAVSIQNEPNYVAGYDGCEWTGVEMRDFFTQVGHFTQGVPGYGGGRSIPSVKTMNGESANNVNVNDAIMRDAGARADMDLMGRHNYGDRNTSANASGWTYRATDARETWMTEHNLNSNSSISYPNDHTWNYIWQFMNAIDVSVRVNHEGGYIWWSAKRFYSMIGDGTYGSIDGEILPRGWGLAHYARFAKESYRVGVGVSGSTRTGQAITHEDNTGAYGGDNEPSVIANSKWTGFTGRDVKVSAFMKLRSGEEFPVNWRDMPVGISEVAEISMVMFTPTGVDGSGGYDMGTVRLQMPEGFRISSATAMRSNPTIFNRNTTNRGTPVWEAVEINGSRDAAFVSLPVSTILSVRFTQD